MSDLQDKNDLQDKIDEMKSRHQEQLNQLSKSHNDEQIALTKEFADKLQYEIKDKADSLKLFVTDDKDKTPEQRKDAIAQIQANFEQKKKFLDHQKQERKQKLIAEYDKKKNELIEKQKEELRKLKEDEEKSKDPKKGPKGGKGRGGKKPNNGGDEYYWQYIFVGYEAETLSANWYDIFQPDGIISFEDAMYLNGYTYSMVQVMSREYIPGKKLFRYAMGKEVMRWRFTNKDQRMINGTPISKIRSNLYNYLGRQYDFYKNNDFISNYVRYRLGNIERHAQGDGQTETNYSRLEITVGPKMKGQPGGNGGPSNGDGYGDDKNGKKKKYKLYEFKYDIVITYDDGSIVKDPHKRIGLHESEFGIYVQDGPFGTSWYEDITSYTYLKRRSEETNKITYGKKQYISENPIASRRLVMMGLNQVKDVKIENVRKVKTIPCDRIINEDLLKILPYTSKLMTAGKAVLTNRLWSGFLADQIFGGLLQEKDLYDIPELTKEHCLNYVSNVDISSNVDYMNELLKESEEDESDEIVRGNNNIYNKIVNANNNVLNLPARIFEKGQPVIKIPFGLLWNFEMEANNDFKRFIAHVQQSAILFQKELFGFITDFIIKTLTGNLPSLGNITQGVLIPIEEKSKSDQPQSQSYFVPSPAPVATAVTASMQIAAIETIAQGTITTLTGGLISGNLLVVMASQVTALVVEFLTLPGLNVITVAAGQAVLATVKSLVYVLGEIIGKVAAKIITWSMIALLDIIIVGTAVIVTQAIKKPITISDYAFILGINYGKPPDLHFFGLNQTNESDSHLQLIEAAKQFRENTGNKKYDRVIGYGIPKNLKTQPITKKEIGSVIDLTDDKNPQVISGKELKMLYALQFMYLFENVEEMKIPDRPCVLLPPPIPSTSPSPS